MISGRLDSDRENKIKDIVDVSTVEHREGILRFLIVKMGKEVLALKLLFQRAQIQFTALISAHIGLYFQLQGI